MILFVGDMGKSSSLRPLDGFVVAKSQPSRHPWKTSFFGFFFTLGDLRDSFCGLKWARGAYSIIWSLEERQPEPAGLTCIFVLLQPIIIVYLRVLD